MGGETPNYLISHTPRSRNSWRQVPSCPIWRRRDDRHPQRCTLPYFHEYSGQRQSESGAFATNHRGCVVSSLSHIPPGAKVAIGMGKDAADWGLELSSAGLIPITSRKAPTPPELLKLLSCKCKKGCRGDCTCLKAGLECSVMCATCSGGTCQNAALIIIGEDDDDETQENPNEPQDNHDAPPMMAYSPLEEDDDDDDYPPIVGDVPVEESIESDGPGPSNTRRRF
ncbi:unnamed protein product [Phaedon cochleariae]|uniref:Tesmin/TSO1-like CXC domain-containing protein n=1 Tax=Phaedon cochleariae TaxID=80249 RepID=A0A9N9X0G1_PHACE|nr:unnamed protein product [Phaedon cochleariae]